jgi:hypothetical protein
MQFFGCGILPFGMKNSKIQLTKITDMLHYLCAQGWVVDHISRAFFTCGCQRDEAKSGGAV